MYRGARTLLSARWGWGVGGGLGTPCAQKKGVRYAIKLHNTLLKQVSLRFNSSIVSERGDTAQSCAPLRAAARDNWSNTMKATNTIKPITFTKTMIGKGVDAIDAVETADKLKLTFFKSIKGRVARDQIEQAKPAFQSVAYAYYDKKHELEGALIEAIIEGKLKETAKLGSLTIRQHKDNVRTMARRYTRYYREFLDTGKVPASGGKANGKKKRATKGAVKSKQVDKAVLTDAPETTPLKRAIENVSSIPRMVLKDTLPSQCGDGLRQEIEIAALQLVELLCKIK